MITLLKDSDALTLPWKNGGGVTQELLKLPHPEEQEGFLLRLSMATVDRDGPFSEFPHIDRILLLLEGNGMQLQFSDKKIDLLSSLKPIHFKGEEKIHCSLVNGSCTDFNIMVDRRYGNVSLEINTMSFEEAQNIVSSDEIYLYQDKKQNLFLIKYHRITTNN